MHRAMRLRGIRPQKKLLLLTVTNFDATDVSSADVSPFVQAELEGMAKEMADLASGNPDAMNAQLGELKNALASGQISDAEKKEMRSALSSMLGGANLDDALRELDRTGGAGLGAQEREALSVLRKALG